MNARGIFALLWMVSCGVASDSDSSSTSSSGSMGRIYPGSAGDSNGGASVQPPALGTDTGTPPMSNTSVCGDGGICSSGVCCGGTCCTIDGLCCADRCVRPTVNQPTCPL